MARRRRKKPEPAYLLSSGPLPRKLAGQHQGLLVFSDASKQTCGGLAAILFETPDSEPRLASCSVPLDGSNALELAALVFGLRQAEQHFPGRPLTLFSDNIDAVDRINRAKMLGLAQDPLLENLQPCLDLAAVLGRSRIFWIKSHATCRGNALADEAARGAALRSAVG